MSKKKKELKQAAREKPEAENSKETELTESALKGTHQSDFSLEQEQKAKEEKCEREEGDCDESRK